MNNQSVEESVKSSVVKGFVYVQGQAFNNITSRVFKDYGYSVVKSMSAADIVVWTGGEDINPSIYGERPLPVTHFNSQRDKEDIQAIEKAENKFKVGICRGAQLLNCFPNMGKLWQHVDNHAGSHHEIIDVVTGMKYTVNSVHHQQMRLTNKAELIAYTSIAKKKEADEGVWTYGSDKVKEAIKKLDYDSIDVEAAWYPDTKSLLFQGHPEFGHKETTDYFFSLMDRFWAAA